jgi:hypothetical protein
MEDIKNESIDLVSISHHVFSVNLASCLGTYILTNVVLICFCVCAGENSY